MPNGEIRLSWGDGEHTFNIAKIGQVLELEEKVALPGGVFELFEKVRLGRARMSELREVMRLGLIGGGMGAEPALRLVDRYLQEWPWAVTRLAAQSVLAASLVGVPGDPVGKEPAERATTEAPSASSAPPSTAPEPPSSSLPDKSTT